MPAAGKRYVLAYNSTAESNIVDFPDELEFHSHEEADTLIVLHSNCFCQKKSILSIMCIMFRHRYTPLAFVLLPADM